MQRLRKETPFENLFPFLPLQSNSENQRESDSSKISVLKILCQNIINYESRQQSIYSDYGFLEADVIFLVEGHIHTSRVIKVKAPDGYNTLKITSGRGHNTSCGQICFIRSNLDGLIRFVACNADHENQGEWDLREKSDFVELYLIRYDHSERLKVFLCCVYKHPKMTNDVFWMTLKTFLIKHIYSTKAFTDRNQTIPKVQFKVFITGDMNIDFNCKTDIKETLRKEIKILPTLEKQPTFFRWEKLSHSEKKLNASQLDWTFQNKHMTSVDVSTHAYECWFSDHMGMFNVFVFND